MAKQIRFYFDEHIHKAVAQGLRQRGIDVVRAQEVGLRRADDIDHLEFARGENRVLVTQDADFLRMHRDGLKHTGIAYCSQGSKSIGEMIESLTLIYRVLDLSEMDNRLEYM